MHNNKKKQLLITRIIGYTGCMSIFIAGTVFKILFESHDFLDLCWIPGGLIVSILFIEVIVKKILKYTLWRRKESN